MVGQACFTCKHNVYLQQKEWEEARCLTLIHLKALLSLLLSWVTTLTDYSAIHIHCVVSCGLTNKEQHNLKFKQLSTVWR
jgi:hypothetical protein